MRDLLQDRASISKPGDAEAGFSSRDQCFLSDLTMTSSMSVAANAVAVQNRPNAIHLFADEALKILRQ